MLPALLLVDPEFDPDEDDEPDSPPRGDALPTVVLPAGGVRLWASANTGASTRTAAHDARRNFFMTRSFGVYLDSSNSFANRRGITAG